MTSKVEIISQAFGLLGKPPINDIVTTNLIHVSASRWYDTLLDQLLSVGQPWRFASATQQLAQLTQTLPEVTGWKYLYQLPTNPKLLLLNKVYPQQTPYLVYEDKLASNSNEVTIEYIFKPDENAFPSYFTITMIYKMAASIGMEITQDIEIVKLWSEEAVRQERLARHTDGKQNPSQVLPSGQIYQAHFVNNIGSRTAGV